MAVTMNSVKKVFTENQENVDPHSNIQPKEQSKMLLSKLMINKKLFEFGEVLPGQILEDEFSICNPLNCHIEIKMQVLCENPEFEALDEYVFTVRSADSNKYHHRHKTLFVPFSKAVFKVALKVPNCKQEQRLFGLIRVSLSDKFETSNCEMRIPLKSFIRIPSMKCPKSLFIDDFNVIKLAAKKGRKTDLKLPLQNLNDLNIFFLVDVLSNEIDEVDVFLAGSAGQIQSFGNGLIFLTIRVPSITEQQVSRKVLVFKVRGSSVFISFPILIEIY